MARAAEHDDGSVNKLAITKRRGAGRRVSGGAPGLWAKAAVLARVLPLLARALPPHRAQPGAPQVLVLKFDVYAAVLCCRARKLDLEEQRER